MVVAQTGLRTSTEAHKAVAVLIRGYKEISRFIKATTCTKQLIHQQRNKTSKKPLAQTQRSILSPSFFGNAITTVNRKQPSRKKKKTTK